MRAMSSSYLLRESTRLERSVCLVTRKTSTSRLTGTGWLCSEDGWIITAGHIFVQDGVTYSSDIDSTADTISVKFPDLCEMPAQLIYAEKRDREGIDFAVLCLIHCSILGRVLPLCVSLDSRYWTGEVRIAGVGSIYQSFTTAAMGYVESSMVNIEYATDSFLHIISENAVQKGYSGGPVFSMKANAVIAIQVMASKSSQHSEEFFSSYAECRTINAMTIYQMVKRYPALESHLIILKRAFSRFDILKAIEKYKGRRNAYNQFFNEKTIDETILPMVEEQEIKHEETRDLNQPVLDAIHKAHSKNCFVLGEEGGSGKTMILLKLFSAALRQNTIKKIPLYIELRNLPGKTEQYNVYDNPGMLFADYLTSELSDSYFSGDGIIMSKSELREKLYLELREPSCNGTEYVFLLDGLNEVSLARRPEICEEILFWMRHPHIQVIVTSRYKEDLLVEGSERTPSFGSFEDFFVQDRKLEGSKGADNGNAFLLLIIQKLEDQVISDYLSENGIQKEIIHEAMGNRELLEILKIPMYLTIFAKLYNKKIKSHKMDLSNRLMDICTRGELLYEFFGEKELQITDSVDVQKDKLEKKDYSEIRKKKFIFDRITPYIAFYMAAKQNYSVTENDLVKLIDNLLKEEHSIMKKRALRDDGYKTVYELYYDRSNLGGKRDIDTRYEPAETIIRFIVEELHIMRKIRVNRDWKTQEMDMEETSITMYEFLHENLRDYFAARQMQEDVRCFVSLKMHEDLSFAYRNIPKTVLEFFGDICREHESQPYYDRESRQWVIKHKSYILNALGLLRGRHDEDAKVMVSNIIMVMQYSRKNDLSGLDLHDIDFSETWLGGIRFSRSYGDTYFSAIFDGATINASNLLRNGHDATVTCVRRDRFDSDIIYSADESGCIMQWNCKKKNGYDICQLNENIRDMLLPSVGENVIYIASEHVIYRLKLSDQTISKLYETKVFIWELKPSDSGIFFKTDMNPVEWIELIVDENGKLVQVIGDEYSMAFWPVAHSCESSDGTYLVTGGSSKAHRVQVFHKLENGGWDRIPIQTVPLPYGKRMSRIEMSKDETKILFCVQNYLYEYSLTDGMLDIETFRLNAKSEFGFASYWYNETGSCGGILYSNGAEIVLLDRSYKVNMRLNSGNGFCHFVSPFLIDHDYRFSRQSGMQRGVQEKYHLYMDGEIQEFDADTNICNRIFNVKNRTKLGYCLSDQKVRLFFQNLHSLNLQNFQFENTKMENIQFIDYAEMKGSVSFNVQRLGRQIIVYDRYTGENDSFKGYRGLFIQGCSMKNLKGDMQNSHHREILRRYGAILEE